MIKIIFVLYQNSFLLSFVTHSFRKIVDLLVLGLSLRIHFLKCWCMLSMSLRWVHIALMISLRHWIVLKRVSIRLWFQWPDLLRRQLFYNISRDLRWLLLIFTIWELLLPVQLEVFCYLKRFWSLQVCRIYEKLRGFLLMRRLDWQRI